MLDRQRQVGVVADHERVLASELEAHLGQHRTLAHRPLNRLARRHRAGKADETDTRILDQRLADLAAEALHH